MFSRWQKAAITLTLVSALLTSACSSGLVKSLAAVNALRQHLIEKYHEDVGVNLQNSRFLSIVFTNSPLNQQDSAKRAQRAQETARFVTLNYSGIRVPTKILGCRWPDSTRRGRKLTLVLRGFNWKAT